jgi:hypothetical protein
MSRKKREYYIKRISNKGKAVVGCIGKVPQTILLCSIYWLGIELPSGLQFRFASHLRAVFPRQET